MPINISTSNYINTQAQNASAGQSVSTGTLNSNGEVSVSVKGLDLQTGQTLSGQIIEIDGKDIKLLLSNNQTINARLEGNINALLGQTLSFEVKNTEDGLTSLRPLYTNLNNSQNVSNALSSAGLPLTDNYAKMVSSMMDENMPINKQAVYDMSKQVNSFPNANPDTVVKLTKLGLQVNELTINQFENYKGLESQISGNVDTLTKGLTELMKNSLSDTVKNANITDISADKVTSDAAQLSATTDGKPAAKNLLSAFLSAITGQENLEDALNGKSIELSNSENPDKAIKELSEENITDKAIDKPLADTDNGQGKIDPGVFDTSKSVLSMVNTKDSNGEPISTEMKTFVEEFSKELKSVIDANILNSDVDSTNNLKSGRENLLNELTKEVLKNDTNTLNTSSGLTESLNASELSGKNVLDFAKNILNELSNNPQAFSEDVKEKLTKLLSSKEFGNLVKDNLTKQMLLKPEEVVNSKNVEELYAKITKQANLAIEIMQNAGKDNPQMLQAANNIKDNVTFMNELNQVVTYVQLPLLMNNKSAHGDLYVYTNKKSLKNNDGNVSALLHLDMENLGPMDVYVALTNKTKLNTHFYLKDEATIDFIEQHIDFLNKRLTEKGYIIDTNISVKDVSKGKTNMADEFFKDDPKEHVTIAAKMSFDVRA